MSAWRIAFTAWVALSCLYWLVTAWLTLRTRRRMPRLADLRPEEPARWPRVSLIVPARDEEREIAAAVHSRLTDGYPELELILVDDRSTDRTGELCDELARADARVRALHLRELPQGWLGKTHALDVGARAASGEWLLFSDADVSFRPGTLKLAIASCEARGRDFLAVVPELWGASFWLEVLMVGFGRGFALSRRMWAVEDPASDAAAGVGAFNLVRRAAFERTPGFEWLRLDVADDVALGLLMKRSGARCSLALGAGLIGLRWYPDLPSAARGLEKNTFAVFGFRLAPLAATVAVWLALELGAVAGLWPLGPGWLVALALAALGAGLLASGLSARDERRRLSAVALLPVGVLLLAYVMLRAGALGWHRGGIYWRGTFFPSALLRTGQRVRAIGR